MMDHAPQTEVHMPDAPRPCDTHPDLVGFKYPLSHLTQSLKRQRKVKIVAIGSSSTAGADNVVPYPCRLELALRQRFYGRMIDVINRGIGGQEAPEELSRFEADVIGEAPALVIWQVGTNAIYRKVDYNLDDVAKAIAAGLDWLADLPIDVVLMDLQYTTALVGPDKLTFANQMETLISAAAEHAKVNVFSALGIDAALVSPGQNSARGHGRRRSASHQRLGDRLHYAGARWRDCGCDPGDSVGTAHPRPARNR
jgi:acyl-CoA thioesterase I